jgi:hypothetical protein
VAGRVGRDASVFAVIASWSDTRNAIGIERQLRDESPQIVLDWDKMARRQALSPDLTAMGAWRPRYPYCSHLADVALGRPKAQTSDDDGDGDENKRGLVQCCLALWCEGPRPSR